MVQFESWCAVEVSPQKKHYIQTLSANPEQLEFGIRATAEVVPGHYLAENRVARVFARLGKHAAAQLVQEELPTSKQIRSGDLGEILATEWIDTRSQYKAPIKRLQWKDQRNMAMRGEDVIGLSLDPKTNRLSFLKTEAKSRSKLSAQVLSEARKGLDKDDGLPSNHALAFISTRLHDAGKDELADAIDEAMLVLGIPPQSVCHLLFVFSGNSPTALLERSMTGYSGTIAQWGVGLHVENHADFIKAVYEQVVANANND